MKLFSKFGFTKAMLVSLSLAVLVNVALFCSSSLVAQSEFAGPVAESFAPIVRETDYQLHLLQSLVQWLMKKDFRLSREDMFSHEPLRQGRRINPDGTPEDAAVAAKRAKEFAAIHAERWAENRKEQHSRLAVAYIKVVAAIRGREEKAASISRAKNFVVNFAEELAS